MTRIMPWLLSALALLALMLAIPIAMRASVEPYRYGSVSAAKPAEAAVVLGASVAGNVLSPLLQERADAALALYRAGLVKEILVSGDNLTPSYDEVDPVREYLLAAGVPSSDILVDRLGLDTFLSMYRARALFHLDSVIITTQDFHLPRALWLARMLGLQAHGLAAAGGSLPDYLREIPAALKAVWDVSASRLAQALGAR